MKMNNPQQLQGNLPFAWTKAIWLYFILGGALAAAASAQLIPSLVAASLGALTLCLGHSVGLHRGVIHKAYETSPALRRVLLFLFTLVGLGGPQSWIRLHYYRDYWQNQEECPPYFAYKHGLLRDFWWNLHFRYEPFDPEMFRVPEEHLNDPWMSHLERFWWVYNLAFAAIIFALGGWAWLGPMFFGRVAAGIIGHWFVGYVAHVWGYRRFSIDGATEEGRNMWFVGVISFGEGFHNNHHARPSSACFGDAWWELDAGWYALCVMEKLGLVWGIRAPGRADEGASKKSRVLAWRSRVVW